MKGPVYGEEDVTLRYVVRNLLWRPVGKLVRFVAVEHSTRGVCLLMTTDTTLDPVEVIRGYGLRAKIEYAFKQAVYMIGTFAYHFWMKGSEAACVSPSGEIQVSRLPCIPSSGRHRSRSLALSCRKHAEAGLAFL